MKKIITLKEVKVEVDFDYAKPEPETGFAGGYDINGFEFVGRITDLYGQVVEQLEATKPEKT